MNVRVCTLTSQFWSPLRREWGMLHGLIDCSKESLHYVLNIESSTDNAVVLSWIAIETDAQLVPTYCFGENEHFKQIRNPEGSYLRYFQRKLKKITKILSPIFYGRLHKPLNDVVRTLIPVTKKTNPTQEEIDCLHRLYISALTELFATYKTEFGVPKNMSLIIR